MSATFSTLRIGELLRVTAIVLDTEGQQTFTDNPQFFPFAGGVFSVVSGEFSHQCLISGQASGSDLLSFVGQDGFDNGVVVDAPVTVLDASQFQFIVSGAQNCTLGQAGDTLRIVVAQDPPGDPSFILRLVARDARFGLEANEGPSYGLSDGPNLYSDHQRLLFNGFNTISDTAVMTILATARGEETLHAFGVSSATGVLISGELPCLIVTAASVTLVSEPV